MLHLAFTPKAGKILQSAETDLGAPTVTVTHVTRVVGKLLESSLDSRWLMTMGTFQSKGLHLNITRKVIQCFLCS